MRYVAFVVLGFVLSIVGQVAFGYYWGTAGLPLPESLGPALALLSFPLGFLVAWVVTIRGVKGPFGRTGGIVLGAFSGAVVFFILVSLPGAIPSTQSPFMLLPLYAIVGIPLSLAAGYLLSLRLGPSRQSAGGFLGALVIGVVLGLAIVMF